MAGEDVMLAQSELMRGVGSETLERLSILGRRIPASSGQVLFRLGDAAENLYVILRGRVALTLPMEIRSAQQDVTVDEKGPGDVLGWSALVPPHRATLSARAIIDSELFLLPSGALGAALREHPAAGLQVMTNLASVIGRRMHLLQAMWLRELQRLVTARYA
jgi:CRP/FNR family transcriptional regulator, cyclic AMP receptor protein